MGSERAQALLVCFSLSVHEISAAQVQVLQLPAYGKLSNLRQPHPKMIVAVARKDRLVKAVRRPGPAGSPTLQCACARLQARSCVHWSNCALHTALHSILWCDWPVGANYQGCQCLCRAQEFTHNALSDTYSHNLLICASTSAAVWLLGSQPDCDSQAILVIPLTSKGCSNKPGSRSLAPL